MHKEQMYEAWLNYLKNSLEKGQKLEHSVMIKNALYNLYLLNEKKSDFKFLDNYSLNSKTRSVIMKNFKDLSEEEFEKIYTRLKVQGILKLTNFAQAELDVNKLDFGDVKLGETYTKTLKMKNTGTINLLVVELIHGPEIVPIFSQKEITADQETEIKVEYRPMKAGKFNSFLKIRTNAYRQRLLIVRIGANVSEK